MSRGALLSHRSAGGRWCRKAPKGGKKPPEVADYRSPCPLSESEHNLPPLGGHNPRAKGPSTLTPAGRVHGRSPLNPGHSVAPWAIPQSLGPQGPSNLRTLRPIGPVKLKNLFPQPFYTTHGGAVPLRTQQAQPPSCLGQHQADKTCQEEEDVCRQAVVRIEGILFPLHLFIGAGLQIFIVAFRYEAFVELRQILGIG